MSSDTKKAVALALCMAAIYLFLVEVVLLWPTGDALDTQKLGSNDIIALAGGMLTAAGLSALWLQLSAASEASRQASAAAALRFDELHKEFNTPEIRVMRDLGWHYLKFLAEDPDRLKTFARWWVLSEAKAPAPPEHLLRDADLKHLEQKRLTDYTWALSTMVAFFVRIENRLHAHYPDQTIDRETLQMSIGPFFWEYWEPYILPLAEVCDRVFEDEAEGRFDRPYFSIPLVRLSKRFPERVKARAEQKARHEEKARAGEKALAEQTLAEASAPTEKAVLPEEKIQSAASRPRKPRKTKTVAGPARPDAEPKSS